MEMTFRQKYFGNSAFYRRVANLAIPSMLQQLLSSAMGIVDTIMVSWIGAVSAVGTGSQLEAICVTIAFGVMEGVGIFAAQFFGAEDYHNMRRTFGLALLLNGSIGLAWLLAITLAGRSIVSFYVKDPAVISQAMEYLNIVRFSYPLTCIAFTYNYLFRCMHKTSVPMFLSILAMGCNCFFNYVLIFGKLGFPQLGVAGAAWGTLIAQSVSVLCYVTYTIRKKVPFIGPLKEMFALDSHFVGPIMQRTWPTICNEAFFSFGASMFIKAYGLLGTTITDAYYVGNTITNIFFSVCNGVSVASGMILGAELGHGDRDRAITESRWFLSLAVILMVAVTVFIVSAAGPMVSLFGLKDPTVVGIARGVVKVASVRISMRLLVVVIFSAMRAGGDSRFLMALDSGVMWAVGIPLAYFLIVGLGMTNFVQIFLLVQLEQVVRIAIGMRRFVSNRWAVNLTGLVD